MGQPAEDIESDLVDLSEATLADLPNYEEEALAPVTRRVARRLDDPEGNTSGFDGSGSRLD